MVKDTNKDEELTKKDLEQETVKAAEAEENRKKDLAERKAAAEAAADAAEAIRTAPKASFEEVTSSDIKSDAPHQNIDRILDIPVTVSVEVGRVKMLIN
ncbi:MAG: hypothetical protein V3T30_08405, partial [Thermodesulfobacteriota bacterium]